MADQVEAIVGDPELITRVRAGDPDAYAELYRRHAPAATNLARQFARGAAEVDDLVAESFAKVLDGLRAGKGPDTAFRAYLFTTLRHTAYDRTRKDAKLSFTDDETAFDVPVSDPDTVLLQAENKLVGRAYGALPERWQAVLWYLSVEGYSPAKTGELLGLTPNAVTSLAFRAREGLRESYLQAHLADTEADECRGMVSRLGAWTRDGLSKRERALVDAHLQTCDDCRALAAELQEVNSGLRGLLAPVLLGGAAAGYLALLGPATAMVKIGALTTGGKALVGPGVGGAAAGGAAGG
ncbi:MAG: sigma-70 family RNA polymerase sigma factor, partial [Actinomycetota bacterium]|nr:sigma-70 family RNA polymerase sigma factor [Actinomycetota bacterium]